MISKKEEKVRENKAKKDKLVIIGDRAYKLNKNKVEKYKYKLKDLDKKEFNWVKASEWPVSDFENGVFLGWDGNTGPNRTEIMKQLNIKQKKEGKYKEVKTNG